MSAQAMDICDLLMRAYLVLLGTYFIYHVMDLAAFKAEHGYRPFSHYGYMAAAIVTAIAIYYFSWRV